MPNRIGSGDALPLFLEFVHHLRGQFAGRRMTRKFVGGGEKKSFEGQRVGREIANQRRVACRKKKIARRHKLAGLELAGDVKHGFALAHSERLLEDLSVGDFPENVTSGHGVVKEIFAGLQRAFGMTPRVNFEGQLAADHAILFQQKGDVPARSSVGNIDKNALFRETLVGVRDAVPHPCGVSASGQYDDQH